MLASAQVITNDKGDNKIVTINDTVFNFTTTPHRFGNTGFITLNIRIDKEINKSFIFKQNGQKEYTIDMNDSSSVSYNTPIFNVVDGCNETLTLDEFNLTLNTVFRTQEISLLNILNLETMSPVTINPNDSIQTAIDNANPGDTILLNGGTYNQHDINVTKVNLTIKASGNGGVPIINGEGKGRGFNMINSGDVAIQGLTITNTISNRVVVESTWIVVVVVLFLIVLLIMLIMVRWLVMV
ncbi:MAG: PGF-pre-PGF domain-containing protein partial [Methanobrevibacter sp. CfCl-M3]